MLKYSLRRLSLAFVWSLFAILAILPAQAAAPDPGDEHWASDLTVSGFDGSVTNLVSDRQGNFYAGGTFTAIGGHSVGFVAKWDGSTWSGLGGGLERPANTLAVDSRGNLYTDALVTAEGALPETLVMRWDGSTWAPLQGDLSGLVDSLAENRESNILINDLVVDSRDQLYAGGYFYLANTGRYVGYVARWDGSRWTLLGDGMDNTVYHLAVDGQDNLYASGEFTSAGGVPANRVASWDGTTWSSLGSGLGGGAPIISEMAADSTGNLFVTGQFESAGGAPIKLIARWDGVSWSELAPGESQGWFEGEGPFIYDLAISQSGELYAGGSFASIDGVSANNIARWDGSSWSALSAENGDGPNERVYAIAVGEDGQVVAGGLFTSAGGLPAHYIARWDGSSWYAWDEGSQDGMNNIVQALAVAPDGILYAGGYFTSAGKLPANYIARWDGGEWESLSGGMDAPVQALVLDGKGRGLYAGGDFSAAGGVPANRIAHWDGKAWSALGDGMAAEHASPQVRALAVDDQGNLYAGGDFTTAGEISANYIARWDGATWSPLGQGMNAQVTDLAFDPLGDLYAAGWFTQAGEVEANGIARWDGASWSALGSGAGVVEALAIGPDGDLYAAGMFYIPPDSSTFHYLARWDGASWNPLGAGVDHSSQALAVDHQGDLISAGDFMDAGGAPARRIARWDGASWSSLGSGIGLEGDTSSIAVLAVDERGNLYVGGQFTQAGNKPSAYLAKWCAELEAGVCSFAFETRAEVPEQAQETPTPVPSPVATRPASTTQPAPVPSLTPAVDSTGLGPGAGLDVRMWVGAGAFLALLLGGLLFFLSRHSQSQDR